MTLPSNFFPRQSSKQLTQQSDTLNYLIFAGEESQNRSQARVVSWTDAGEFVNQIENKS